MSFYCEKCGNELLPKSEFCNKCGNEIGKDPRMTPTSVQREKGFHMMGFHMGMPQMMIIMPLFFVMMIIMMVIMATLFGSQLFNY